MPSTEFMSACERLAGSIDPGGQESRRWARNEGVVQSKAVELAKRFFEEEGEFELVESRSLSNDTRAQGLRHKGANRNVATFLFKAAQDHLTMWVKPSEDDGFGAFPPAHHESVPLNSVDEQSVDQALSKLLGTIRHQGD
jgi:hypothetical protein